VIPFDFFCEETVAALDMLVIIFIKIQYSWFDKVSTYQLTYV